MYVMTHMLCHQRILYSIDQLRSPTICLRHKLDIEVRQTKGLRRNNNTYLSVICYRIAAFRLLSH